MQKLLLVLFSIFLTATAYSQDEVLEDLSFVKKLSKETTDYIASSDFATAADYVQPFWPMPKSEFERFETQATKSIKAISEGLGKPLGTVKVKEQTLGGILFKEVYFIQYEKAPLRIEYIYYKRAKGWVIENIQWDTDYEAEFD